MDSRLIPCLLLMAILSACGSSGSSDSEDGGSDGTPRAGPCTVTVLNGSYSTAVNAGTFPPGSVVCAQTDGGVEYTGTFRPSGYSMRGFVVNSSQEKTVSNGIFERMSFVGGPACGNQVNTYAGSNTVIRESAFYGEGGRYLLLPYQESNVAIYDVIFRVDGGWGEGGAGCTQSEPNAALNIYDTNRAYCDHCYNFDTNNTADGSSEKLGGLGINTHSFSLCYTVEIRNSIDLEPIRGFWADGNGSCNTKYTNNLGRVNLNLAGNATVTRSSGPGCNYYSGTVTLVDNDFPTGNCSDGGVGAAVSPDKAFLDDPRWRAEMCDGAGSYSSRTDGWCATAKQLSDYLTQ